MAHEYIYSMVGRNIPIYSSTYTSNILIDSCTIQRVSECVCLTKIATGIIQIFVSVPAYYSISTLLFITESIYWMHSPQIMFHVSNWQLGIGNMTCLFAMELILYSIRRKLVKSLVNPCDVMWFEWRTDHTRTITITCVDIQIITGPLKHISSLCSIVCAVSRKIIKHGLSYFLWTNSQGWVTFMEVQDWSLVTVTLISPGSRGSYSCISFNAECCGTCFSRFIIPTTGYISLDIFLKWEFQAIFSFWKHSEIIC